MTLTNTQALFDGLKSIHFTECARDCTKSHINIPIIQDWFGMSPLDYCMGIKEPVMSKSFIFANAEIRKREQMCPKSY